MNENIQIINNIETEIEKAVELCQKQYSRDEIWQIIRTNSEENPSINLEKQMCILKLDSILSQEEANILIFHQTNHHGLIREACAHKINDFCKKPDFLKYFQTEEILKTLINAINDVNPNICRLIIEILPRLENKKYFLDLLYERIETVFDELEQLKRSTWYTKKLFNLYWCLEALAVIEAPIDSRLEYILKKTSMFRDYTIREKTAMVLHNLKDTSSIICEIKKHLKNDDNYYVKRYSLQW